MRTNRRPSADQIYCSGHRAIWLLFIFILFCFSFIFFKEKRNQKGNQKDENLFISAIY